MKKVNTKLYIVLNENNVVMGAFTTKRKANVFIKNVGGFRWQEKWKLEIQDLDKPEQWVLRGNDSFVEAKRRLKKDK